MKKIFLLALSLIAIQFTFAQGMWTWMSGPNTTGQAGVYGTQGVPSATNNPPAMYSPYVWTDLLGNFWLYGSNNDLADLWKFNPSTMEWTWVKGPAAPSSPVFGTMGVPAINNTPGSRSYNGTTWVDLNGDFWLYGGISSSVGDMADLWRYQISNNMWTWMSGSQTPNLAPVWGTLGVPAATNSPGSRRETGSSWTDNSGNLWVYGGFDQAGNSLADMWMYNTSTNLWTWESGSQTLNIAPNYGTVGVYSPANSPGGRFPYSMWKDPNNHFWLFGGGSGGGSSLFADLWEYDPSINQWAWISGTQTMNAAGNAGAVCVSDSSYYPDGRFEDRAAWRDVTGNLWLFGGFNSFSSTMGDLWVYLTQCNEWARMSPGSFINAAPVYGTLGVPAITNQPGSRAGPAHWQDSQGNFWIFGGWDVTGTYCSDIWKYTPDLSCVNINCAVISLPVASFTGNNSFCLNTCTTFTNTSSPNCTSWQWTFPGGIPHSFSGQNPPQICYDTVGNFTAQLIASNANGSDTATMLINVHGCPPVAAFYSNDTTICKTDCIIFTDTSSQDVITWHWTFNGGNPSTFNGEVPPSICYPAPGVYLAQLIVFNLYGSDTASYNITVQDCSPVASFTIDDQSICIDSCTGFVNTSTGGTAWHWIFAGGTPSSFTGQNPPTVCYHAAGQYTVTLIVSNNYGSDTAESTITVHANPVVSVSPPLSSIYVGESVQLNATGGVTYQWDPPGGLTNPFIANPVAAPFEHTVYHVTVTDADGCKSSDSLIIDIIPNIHIPDAFSPNSDGINDYFRLINPQDVASLDIKIFNRWGQLIFESNDPFFKWDGTFKGVNEEIDVYVYEITYTMMRATAQLLAKGNITLIR